VKFRSHSLATYNNEFVQLSCVLYFTGSCRPFRRLVQKQHIYNEMSDYFGCELFVSVVFQQLSCCLCVMRKLIMYSNLRISDCTINNYCFTVYTHIKA